MKTLSISDEAYEWFQKARKIKVDKRKFTIQENELLILMLNIWEAGNTAKQVSDCIKEPATVFPLKIFKHYNGKFYRSY